MRADKFLFHHKKLGKKAAQKSIAEGRLWVNGRQVSHAGHEVGKFDQVRFDTEILANARAHYIMLHKPAGYVCATTDKLSPTVLELLPEMTEPLHLAGRLDKFTTGLVILTNDGKWSREITSPSSKVGKVYRIEAENKIENQMIEAFKAGVFFEKEKVKTQAAGVTLITPMQMELTIYEGMHHQIKRMLLKFNNRVVSLHRKSIGTLHLDLPEGDFRELTEEELQGMGKICSPEEPHTV